MEIASIAPSAAACPPTADVIAGTVLSAAVDTTSLAIRSAIVIGVRILSGRRRQS